MRDVKKYNNYITDYLYRKQSQSFGKPWFARELQDFEGFADENVII